MKKIVAFGASTSKNSINKKLANYAAGLLQNVEVELLDLNVFELPLFSVDLEAEIGMPANALAFREKIHESDGLVVSFAEHNGSFSAAYKNLFDWASRVKPHVWEDKPMVLLATSTGKRGAIGVLELASKVYGFANKNVVGKFSLPLFRENFSEEAGILDEVKAAELENLMQSLNGQI